MSESVGEMERRISIIITSLCSAYYNKKYRNYGQVSINVEDERVHLGDDKGNQITNTQPDCSK